MVVYGKDVTTRARGLDLLALGELVKKYLTQYAEMTNLDLPSMSKCFSLWRRSLSPAHGHCVLAFAGKICAPSRLW